MRARKRRADHCGTREGTCAAVSGRGERDRQNGRGRRTLRGLFGDDDECHAQRAISSCGLAVTGIYGEGQGNLGERAGPSSTPPAKTLVWIFAWAVGHR